MEVAVLKRLDVSSAFSFTFQKNCLLFVTIYRHFSDSQNIGTVSVNVNKCLIKEKLSASCESLHSLIKKKNIV